MKKSWMGFWIGLILAAAGCASYSNTGDSCVSQADCNPGKTCGDLVACLDGKCNPSQTLHIPCNQSCESDAGCPQGSHCRLGDGGPGTCVLDGTCVDAFECLDLPHDDCLGSFACAKGLCEYTCVDFTSCSLDSECTLADKGCCCGFTSADYIAVRKDRLDDWRARPECQGVGCPDIACQVPDGLFAVCHQGQCTVEGGQVPDWFSCAAGDACLKVNADCCGCQDGGGELAINAKAYNDYLAALEVQCALVGACLPAPSHCTEERTTSCVAGKCTFLGDTCGCPQNWSPVCADTIIFPNECHATCAGLKPEYFGRCDCAVDCFMADPVCAENHVTYGCGKSEAECSDQAVLYPGACSEACDNCLLIGRIPIPVCAEDFKSYPDVCFAECQGKKWWHTGECLAGEGSQCGGQVGGPCPDETTLFCVYLNPGCLACPGVCVERPHCLEASHCDGLPATDPCPGSWGCVDHACVWQCGP
jgi:hypothetical protein